MCFDGGGQRQSGSSITTQLFISKLHSSVKDSLMGSRVVGSNSVALDLMDVWIICWFWAFFNWLNWTTFGGELEVLKIIRNFFIWENFVERFILGLWIRKKELGSRRLNLLLGRSSLAIGSHQTFEGCWSWNIFYLFGLTKESLGSWEKIILGFQIFNAGEVIDF